MVKPWELQSAWLKRAWLDEQAILTPKQIKELFDAAHFVGIDYAMPAQKHCLVLAGDREEAEAFAKVMGFNNWTYVGDYRFILRYRGETCYIVGGGRDREDFDAIEGLFIQGNIKVMDMEE